MFKKELTSEPKVYYNGNKTIIRHCKNVIAICEDGDIYTYCRTCKKWVKVNIKNQLK